MEFVPKSLTSRGSLIDLGEIEPLLKLAHDSNMTVRFSALNTLTHLPLPHQGWVQVAELIRQELQASDSFPDRAKLLEIGSWIPNIFNAKDEVMVIEGVPEQRQRLLDEVDGIRSRIPVASRVDFDRSWAVSQAPGFVLYSKSELQNRRSQFESQASLAATKLSNWYSSDESPEIAIEDPVVVTLLFERTRNEHPPLLRNSLLRLLEKLEYFRPDVNGLFQEYLWCIKEWKSSRDQPLDYWALLGRDDEDPYSYYSWQIAWVVSRGGLTGLVSCLASQLKANDEIRQVAALGLIADSADYTLQQSAEAAQFGGGIRPARLHPSDAAQLWFSDATVTEQAAKEDKSAPNNKFRMLTVAHPQRLSRGEDSLFIVSIHLRHEVERAIAIAKKQFNAGAAKIEPVSTTPSYELDFFDMIVVKLSSQDINFDPDKGVTVKFQDIDSIKTIPFTAKPKATCDPGNRLVRISATRKDTEEEILSQAFRVHIDDYAFDHVSRPLLARAMAFVTGAASVVSYALGLLEQVDKTAGLVAGTAFIVLAGAVGLRSRSVYGKPETMIQAP